MSTKQITPELMELLQRPLPPNAVKPHPTKTYLSHIKAIYVTERLNEVFGIGGWKIKTKLVPINGNDVIITKHQRRNGGSEYEEYTVSCYTELTVPEYDIYYDCIASSTNDDIGDAAKGATTDAINKIASYMGIGADVYKGEYDWHTSCRIHISRCTTVSALQAFFEDNRLAHDFVAGDKESEAVKAVKAKAWAEFKNMVARRKEELEG